MADLDKTIKGLKFCKDFDKGCSGCPYFNLDDKFGENDCMRGQLMPDALELLIEPRKTKDEILLAIVSAIGYKSVDDFKKTAEEVGTLDEFVFGMYRSINAVEKLFAKDGEQE